MSQLNDTGSSSRECAHRHRNPVICPESHDVFAAIALCIRARDLSSASMFCNHGHGETYHDAILHRVEMLQIQLILYLRVSSVTFTATSAAADK